MDLINPLTIVGLVLTIVLAIAAIAIYLLKDMVGPAAAEVADPAPRIARLLRVLLGACVAFVTSFSLSIVVIRDSSLANLLIHGSGFLAAAYLASRIAQERALPAVAIGLSFWVLVATYPLANPAYLPANVQEHLLPAILTVTAYVSLALLAAWWFGRSYRARE